MMKRIALSILFIFFPALVFASASPTGLSLAPQPSDVSVVFLGNIFGIVDGVLHGTGSQILGNMFGMFNSFIQAIGGAVIMYTLIVSTMNTAQEGQMLGQKWSSIWVPVRSTLGLALLTPKASGYCLMQIFVMWIVVQGVGAADKVWGAALNYLNRGGVIVQTQMNPEVSLSSGKSSVAMGATTILQGQVCMAGLQKALENSLQAAVTAKQTTSSGICSNATSHVLIPFCNVKQIPDFIETVNLVAVQSKEPNQTSSYSIKMPNFDTSSPFYKLNGLCGTIKWNPFLASDIATVKTNLSAVTSSDLETAKLSRAIAIQQMYMDLAIIAKQIVNNNPSLNPPKTSEGSPKPSRVSNVALQPFGVPYLDSGAPCTTVSEQCISWGRDPTRNQPPLFNGSEFQGAISDYNGIMLPTLNLVQQAKSNKDANNQRAFIKKADSEGWLMAGSYFFNLSMLNASAINNANLTDSNTGLEGSSFNPVLASSAFAPNGGACTNFNPELCEWLNKDLSVINLVMGMINGTGIIPALPSPDFTPTGHKAVAGIGASTVNGFINNSVMVNLPGQPGMKPPKFALPLNFSVNLGQYQLPWHDFPCGGIRLLFINICIGEILGNLFYNIILRGIINTFLSVLAPFIMVIIQSLMIAPLIAIGQIFQQSVSIIQQPKVNPVVALANMGVNYINFSSDLWILTLGLVANPIAILMAPLIALIMPLLTTWMGVMIAIGFITAYYVPLLPYMIFTFGSIAWLMVVIEAMVAAPIVALGVAHPEGHEAFGKGEQALMILMNVFLRPALMIIGYIAAIGLSYVSVWIINAGFSNAVAFIQGTGGGGVNYSWSNTLNYTQSSTQAAEQAAKLANNFNSMNTGYNSWAGIYGFFFSVLIYTTMYITVVQKAFNLIVYLPDKVLRWIGGQPEGIGEQAAQWAESEPRKQMETGGEKTSKASSARDQKLQAGAEKLGVKAKGLAAQTGTKIFGK